MRKIILAVLMISLSISTAKSQTIDDALRFMGHDAMITTRAGALDISFHGIVDDAAALYYNPAGLSLVTMREFSAGLGMQVMNIETDFLGSMNDLSSTKGMINNITVVSPFKIGDNNAAFSFGYFNEKSFDSRLDMNGFNPNGSRLAEIDTLVSYLDSLSQEIYETKDGSLNNIVLGFAIDLNPNFSIGLSFGFKSGSFDYYNNYYEVDNLHLHEYSENSNTIDFHSMEMDQLFTQDIFGVFGSVGFLGRIGNFMRIGINVKFPTYLDIEENISEFYQEIYDNPDVDGNFDYTEKNDDTNSFSVVTPFVFSGGLSVNFAGLTLTSGVEFSDASALEFDDAHYLVMGLNSDIMKEFTGVFSYGLGLEYEVPALPVVLRGSFAQKSSPYVNADHLEITNISFGAGVYFGKKIRLDFAARLSQYSEEFANYGDSSDPYYYSTFIKDSSPMNLVVGLTYRY